MYAAAMIPYVAEEHDFSLQDLVDHLSANLTTRCAVTEVEEYGESIQEIRVETSTPLSIRIEDNAELVYEDLGDLAERAEGALPPEWIAVLLRCTARLEIQEADVEWVEPDENGAVEVDLYSDLDLTLPDVEAVIVEVARFMDSFAYDNVNDEWLVSEI
jgi:hypothetical protein